MASHLFVAHGDLTRMTVDAALVPMGRDGQLVRPWSSWLGTSRLVPSSTRTAPGSVAAAREGLGYVSDPLSADGVHVRALVSGYRDATPSDLGRRLAQALLVVDDDLRASEAPARLSGRARPLVAMPVFGTRAGGLAGRRGEVLHELLGAAHQVLPDLSYDPVLVCWDRASYAAAQRLRRDLSGPTRPSNQVQGLAEDIASGQVVLLVGAGASAAAGLPAWSPLLDRLAERAREETGPIGRVTEWWDGFEELPLVDRAELLSAVLAGSDTRIDLTAVVSEALGATSDGRTPKPSLQHWLLAGLAVPEVVTTNFDLLLDEAVMHTAGAEVRILPWQTTSVGDRWILKLHGDVRRGHTTLSRDDYLGYDALRRPLASVVQAQLLTRHMLMVGFSLDDENFIRLARGVRSMINSMTSDPQRATLGTALLPWPQPARERLWDNALRFLYASDSNRGAESFRQVEITLDQVAMLAADRASYLLDPEFTGLLTAQERALVTALTSLSDAAQGTAAEAQIRALLLQLGGEPPASSPVQH